MEEQRGKHTEGIIVSSSSSSVVIARAIAIAGAARQRWLVTAMICLIFGARGGSALDDDDTPHAVLCVEMRAPMTHLFPLSHDM